jgi:hypothetical protein
MQAPIGSLWRAAALCKAAWPPSIPVLASFGVAGCFSLKRYDAPHTEREGKRRKKKKKRKKRSEGHVSPPIFPYFSSLPLGQNDEDTEYACITNHLS